MIDISEKFKIYYNKVLRNKPYIILSRRHRWCRWWHGYPLEGASDQEGLAKNAVKSCESVKKKQNLFSFLLF